IPLLGSIGCMVNGAGLAMATMDLIRLKGGEPANFLDIGGSATEEKVSNGFRLLLKDGQVKAIFVNIFGGIMNCKTIANALTKAGHFHVPVILRMEGTEVEAAKAIIASSSMPIKAFDSLDQAAEEVIRCQSS